MPIDGSQRQPTTGWIGNKWLGVDQVSTVSLEVTLQNITLGDWKLSQGSETIDTLFGRGYLDFNKLRIEVVATRSTAI